MAKSSHTPIAKHTRRRKALVTPLNAALGSTLRPVYWNPDRLPDYLWLLICFLPGTRREALVAINQSRSALYRWRRRRRFLPSMQHLARLSDQQFETLVGPFLNNAEMKQNLSAMLVIPRFPGRSRWQRHLNEISSVDNSLGVLFEAVGRGLYQHSHAATDVAYAIQIVSMVVNRALMTEEIFTNTTRRLKEYFDDPRPDSEAAAMVRSWRNMLYGPEGEGREFTQWSDSFWRWGRRATACMTADHEAGDIDEDELRKYQIRFFDALEKNDVEIGKLLLSDKGGVVRDYKTEVISALFMYANQIVASALVSSPLSSPSQYISARVVAEIAITIKYMALSEDTEIFRKFFEYGTGKAKLYFFKMGRKWHNIVI